MDRRTPSMARPAAGAYWFTLARLTVLQQVLALLWFIGIWIWLDDVLVECIRRRSRKESQWRWIWNVYDTLGGALVAPPYHHLSFSRTPIALIAWIAACIYFLWSPEPARAKLIVFGVFGWISAFTCTLGSRVSMVVGGKRQRVT
jgi:hypothetical protein